MKNESYVAWRYFLRQAEGWSVERICEYQLGELQRITKYAYENTEGYRLLYDEAGLGPNSIRRMDDIRRFPFVDRELLRGRLENFSVRMDGRIYITTSGSTGIPFGFYRNAEAFSKELASKAHQYYRVGWREGDRQIVLRGVPIDSADRMVFIPEFNEIRCSSYHLIPEFMEGYQRRAKEYRAEWLRCYPSSGYIFAKYLKETGRPLPSLKGILCASENLYDFQKDLLSEVFGVRIFSHYGHYELAVLAGYCEYEDTYHVLPQYGYAELIDKDGQAVTEPGKTGEIVATSFIMHATPFIRYRTGDFAVLKGWGCRACGRPYQIWERIEGRLQEFIVTGRGRYISMTAINFHDDIFNHIRQFQFHQTERGKVTFRYIPNDNCNGACVEDMKRRLLLKLGNDVEVKMESVKDIPLSSRGKHRFLIQEMKLPFGDA